MKTKTPYELRFELLAMAQSILNENLMSERIRLENDWSLEREKASTMLSNGNLSVKLPPFPVMPKISATEVIELAKKLNEFVSDDSR